MSEIIGATSSYIRNPALSSNTHAMLNTPDLYLGTFLILSGFALSLLNLRRLLKTNTQFSTVLLSENVLLTCIGLAFVSRAVSEVAVENMEMEERSAEFMMSAVKNVSPNCNYKAVLMSYGPLIVSLVNSFLSLIIDNYMHYKMLKYVQEKDDESTVREVNQEHFGLRSINVKKLYNFINKYFSFIAVFMQWFVPVLMVLAMYPMELKEKLIPLTIGGRSYSCMAMLNVNNETCSYDAANTNFTLELRKYASSPTHYIKVYENEFRNNNSIQVDSVVSNVYKIVGDLRETSFKELNVTSPYLFRTSRNNEKCLKMCFIENKSLLLYMFLLAIVSYFVPITISTIILTKIHVMDIQKKNLKTYVSRELLYNILFWTPVMFDTFLSLILCSYSMNGVRTSLFNVVANVYQAVKNFMNTKYFKDNTVLPV